MPISASTMPSHEMYAAMRRGPVADTALVTPSIMVANAAYNASAVIVAWGAIDNAWRLTARAAKGISSSDSRLPARGDTTARKGTGRGTNCTTVAAATAERQMIAA